ncbi:hypothetical protein PIB30_059482 [Stylosanthes scabra]|uniref:Uncharacterized protein n=1 Tax=Stylosanthes scabra TaxID=79078 RepID=A0ABU6RKL8_9FABA|nr:hypothetical protein [Stylosanthes scabra]
MCDDEIAKKVTAKQQKEGEKDTGSSATMDLTEETPVHREVDEPEKLEGRVPSTETNPRPSPTKKRKRAQKEVIEESSTLVNALEKGFDPIPFVDRYLMTSEAEEALEGIEAEDNIVHVQRILLRATVYCQDVQRKIAGIPVLQTLMSEKDKNIKILSSRVTDLEAESKSRGAEVLRLEGVEKTLNEKAKKLEEEKQAAEKRVTKLEASLKKSREDLVAMEKMEEEVEEFAMTRWLTLRRTY